MRGFFSGKRTPEPFLGGMPSAADVCAGCGAPSDLSCCGCGSNYCAHCSTLAGAELERAKQRQVNKGAAFAKKDAPTLYICKKCGGGESGSRCTQCPLRLGNEPTEDARVVKALRGTDHYHAAVNCDLGPIFEGKCPPCSNGMECVNCFNTKTGNRIDDRGPGQDRATAKAARELKYEFGFNTGEVCIEKDSGRRATVVEDGGTGFEAKVVFQGSDVPEVVVPHLVFSHYIEDGVEIELEWPDRRCRLCRLKKGVAESLAQHREARALIDVERQVGVQVRVQAQGEARRDWLSPNPNDSQGRSDQKILADAYNDIEAASLPQEDDAVTGRQVSFGVRHTQRCLPRGVVEHPRHRRDALRSENVLVTARSRR